MEEVMGKKVMDRTEMVKKLESKLNPKRFVHSIGVEYTAANLAFVHGADVEKARLAGLLHDCAKYIPTDEKLKRAKKYGIKVNKCEKANPDLLHGKIGVFIAKEKYGVDDPEILSAIAYHTTGHPDMTLLEKIIFVADYIEPNRRIIRDLPEIRREAYLDLDKCIIHILKNTLEYLETTDAAIDELTRDTYDYYVSK
jgi:putative HD superfamily hydrolase of NAD metabolism